MAKIIYALSGQGRGHTSRVIAISEALRQRGHEVLFCCGGTAREVLEGRGEQVLPVPALRQVMQDNEIRLGQTLRKNWQTVLRGPRIVSRLADTFQSHHPDLLITDFEAFSPRAARRVGLPVLSFNHQQVVTETKYDLPVRYWFHAALTRAVISTIAPSHPEHILLSSFFFPPLKAPSRATLIPPIIRPGVQQVTPRSGNHVLVYYNQTGGAERVLHTLRQVDASFIIYNFDPPADPAHYPNMTFKPSSLGGFLEDLARSRAVICTAGFTLISEALYLGKPLLVIPNQGIFEQTLNALALRQEGLGHAVLDRPPTHKDVEHFLEEAPSYANRLQRHRACGNEEAVAFIEQLLSSRGRMPATRRVIGKQTASFIPLVHLNSY